MTTFSFGNRFHNSAIALWLVCLTSSWPAEAAERVNAIRIPGDAKVAKAQIDSRGTIHLLVEGMDGPLYLKSTDQGLTFSSPIAVLDATSQKPGLKFQAEDLAVGKDGRVHVAMSNNAWKLKLPQEEWGFYYASLEAGAKAFSLVRNVNRKPSEGFSLAADGHGNVAASFLSGKLYTMMSRDNGETFSPYSEPDSTWNPCDCCTTATTYGSDGKLAVLYREETGNERDMYLVLSDQKSEKKPVRTRVSGLSWPLAACPMTYFMVSPATHGYVAAWPTKGEVYFARLDPNGAVLPPGEIKTPGSNGMRTGILALSASDGATLIAWKKSDILGWQLYDKDGKPLGPAGSAASPGNAAAGVLLPNGKFVLFL